MNLGRHLNILKRPIDKGLDKYLPSAKERPKVIHKAMRYSVFSGGKRIRPIIVIESSRACGGRLKDAMPVACAIELVHTYSLIHDDLPSMDNDDYRRGKPTCHKVFGEANAILAGDGLLTLAFNIISNELNPKIGMAVIKEVSDAAGTRGMVGGQVMDLELRSKMKDRGKQDYINRLKTAKLFEVSAKTGAITAACASKKEIRAMAGYGVSLGMAFQIVDDIIDKEGYPHLAGAEKAIMDSEILIKKAKGFLRIFGRRSSRLCEIADYVVDRIKYTAR